MYTLRRDWESLDDAPLEFSGECPVAPKTWERPYAFSRKGKMTSRLPAQTRNYENAVRAWMREHYSEDLAKPMDDTSGALRFEAEFSTPRPQGRVKKEIYAPTKPDLDNFARSFMESLYFRQKTADGHRLGVISLDTPIVSMSLSKRWSERDEWPGTRFSITHDGDGGVAFSDELLSLDSPSRDDLKKTVLNTRIVRANLSDLPPAPSSYARYFPIPPVPWKNPVLYGEHLRTPSEVTVFQGKVRRRAMRDYGLRQPMDGPMLLELDVLLPKKGFDQRWMQWLVLVDYAKNLMDALAWRVNGQAVRTKDDVALGVLAQDSRVCALTATMRHCEGREVPGMRFCLSPICGENEVAPIFAHIETGRML